MFWLLESIFRLNVKGRERERGCVYIYIYGVKYVSLLWHCTIYTLFYVQPEDGFLRAETWCCKFFNRK